METASDPDIDSMRDKTVTFARQIMSHLGVAFLPKELIDDKKKRIDPTQRTEEDLILDHFREDSLHSIKTARFLKDFSLYRAIPDVSTTNESFLRTAEIFRQQGIKNYYFILQLNNPALKGVDPYDEHLTSEQQLMVMQECKENFWYFLREVCNCALTVSSWPTEVMSVLFGVT